jgi:hypothetical protein
MEEDGHLNRTSEVLKDCIRVLHSASQGRLNRPLEVLKVRLCIRPEEGATGLNRPFVVLKEAHHARIHGCRVV